MILAKTMLFTQQYGWMLTEYNNAHIIVISVVITDNYCKYILLYSPLNSLCTLVFDV